MAQQAGLKSKTIGLTRIDIEKSGTHGWMMRICRRGERFMEFFSDKRYGGIDQAKSIGMRRYADLKTQLPEPSKTRDSISKRNRSGVVGVHLAISLDGKKKPYSSYCASWVDDFGKRQKVTFSWKKYGQDVAWELALIAREKQLCDKQAIIAIFENGQPKSALQRVKKPR